MKNPSFEKLKNPVEFFNSDGVKCVSFPDVEEITIFKAEINKTLSGEYLGRYEDFKKYFDLDKPFKGNGFMFLCEGDIYMLPEWKSAKKQIDNFKVGQSLYIKIKDIQNPDSTEDRYINCQVSQIL